MTEFVFIHNIIEENGKTIKENNLEKKHKLNEGDLAEITYEPYSGVRMFICELSRDCDGTPLYSLTANLEHYKECRDSGTPRIYHPSLHTGFSEENLKLIKKAI